MTLQNSNFDDWIPIRVYREGEMPYIDWCYAGEARFAQPFFSDTVQRLLWLPFNQVFRKQTSFEELRGICDKGRVLPPNGFIFHMSRCGSTLVTQMLAASERNVVISEAPPIDSVLAGSISFTSGDLERRQMLKSIVAALGRARFAHESQYFIKFDSWHTLDLGLISEAFPDVPWIFLYRNPVEVIVSQMRQRGSQMIPGRIDRILPDVSFAEAVQVPPEEYCARILARFCESAIRYADHPNCRLVNYSQLPDFVFEDLAGHFHCEFTPAESEQMREAARFNAKTPQIVFEPDTERKRSEATDAALAAAAKWVDPLYQDLEAIRLNRADDQDT